MRIKKDVVTQKLAFVAVDSDDHITRKTGLSSFTVYYSLNGGAAAQLVSPTVAELDATNMPGDYVLTVNGASMVSAAGELIIHITKTGMDDVTRIVEITTNFENDIYDRVGAPAGASIAADLVVIDNFVDDLEGRLTATRAGYLDELGSANLPADIDTLKTQIGTAGDGLTAVPWNAAWDAEVQSEVDDALVVQKLDHLVAVADNDDAVDNSIVAKLASSTGDWSTFVATTDSLQAVRDQGDTAWITATSVTVSDKTGFSLAADQSAVTIGAITGHTAQTGDSYAIVSSGTYGNSALNTDLDALLTRLPAALTAPTQGAPSATPSPMEALAWLYTQWRNKTTTTATLLSLYDDAGSTVLTKSTLSDDATTFQKAEFISGA